MSKSLVIVESPAKARTINRYLGPEFVVKSSVGHIRDLPTGGNGKPVNAQARAAEAAKTRKMKPAQKLAHKKRKARQQLITRMGIDPEHGWKAKYQILPGKEKVVNELKKLARKADHIYLATDLDREGEAIAWHLQESIGGDPERFKRVVFNEITKRAIKDAFADPGQLDMRYVEAQQARRFLDRVVGFMLSPLLWEKVARGLSAGRVQSVAVRLIVEREAAIRAFVAEEYWEVYASLATMVGKVGAKANQAAKSEKLRCQVIRQEGKNFRPTSQRETEAALALLQAADYQVAKREDRPTSSRPRPPLITSTLQQAASTRLGFGVKKTMMMAQRLYEAGHITYMRTDSTHLSTDSIAGCRDFIATHYGQDYLPDKPCFYSSKAGAQEAHEAIRPSEVKVLPPQLAGMERDAVRLYQLIWQFFVACQMPPARYLSSSITVRAGTFELRTKGRIMQFDGYLKVMPSKEEDVVLPAVAVGDMLQLEKLEPVQNFTKPPARFTEASLVKELEKRDIGRPSTYASIISTIQERGYVKVENKRFHALKMGDIVAQRLLQSFADLMDYDFTAKMEDSLDEVAAGQTDWKALLDEFYASFTLQLEKAQAEPGGMCANAPTATTIPCPRCGRPMQIRTASTGVFLGCSGYSLPPKERCKSTLNLTPGEEAIHSDSAEEAEKQENIQLRHKHRCSICHTAMEAYLLDEHRKLHVCGRNPDCGGYEVEQGQFRIRGYDGPLLECDKCGADMQLKNGRFGKYFGCTDANCTNTRKLLRNGKAAPPKMTPVPMPELACRTVDDHYILRDGVAGLFLAASQFPKNREARAPLVEELLPHQALIDPKYRFLCSAPTEDGEGNKTLVRFDKKTGEHYVRTEVDKKPTGWKAVYQDDKWQAVSPEQRTSGGKSSRRKASSINKRAKKKKRS